MRAIAVFLLCLGLMTDTFGWEVRGAASLEERYFPHESTVVSWQWNSSLALTAEVLHDWNDRNDLFTFVPYVRLDEHDSERTQVDIRELSWVHVEPNWESRVGVRKVFWGVTEGRHLVDIVNQTDFVDQIDEEEKFGQPMINFSTVTDWGIFDVYALIGFRERTFPGEEGRPRLPIPIDADASVYESAAEDHRIDFAARWQLYLGDWQIAISHFSGTSRDPLFVSNVTAELAAVLLTT